MRHPRRAEPLRAATLLPSEGTPKNLKVNQDRAECHELRQFREARASECKMISSAYMVTEETTLRKMAATGGLKGKKMAEQSCLDRPVL